MKIEETEIKGLYVIEPIIHGDERGYFVETYNDKINADLQQAYHFIQDNEAKSSYGVVRGLHYQVGEYSQAKLVRVITGSVLDVVVDLRPNSQTLGQSYSITLSSENKLQLLVPRGFAHGYSVLEDNTIFSYKCDNFYNRKAEGGIRYNDLHLAIDWSLPIDHIIVSKKDRDLPLYGDHRPVAYGE